MNNVWFNRSRSAASSAPPVNYFYQGLTRQDVNAGSITLTGITTAQTTTPFSSTTTIKSSVASSDYTSFSPLDITGLSATYELVLVTPDRFDGGSGILYYNDADSTAVSYPLAPPSFAGPFNLGLGYSSDYTTGQSVTGLFEVPDLLTDYNGTASPVSWGDSVVLGVSPFDESPNITRKGFFLRPAVWTAQDQLSGGTVKDIATVTGHQLFLENDTTGSWVRSGYATGVNLTSSSVGMGKLQLPEDVVFAIDAPNDYTIPGGTVFPGVQARVQEVFWYDSGCVRSIADVFIIDAGSGATKNGSSNFIGYLYFSPPSNPSTGDRNTLPLVLEATVTSGAVTSLSLVCGGAGLPVGPFGVTMTWDENDYKRNLVNMLYQDTISTYTSTSPPILGVTFTTDYRPVRSILMNDPGDGYFYTSSAGWNGVNEKQSTYNANTRLYTPSTLGTFNWTSASTGDSGTVTATQNSTLGFSWYSYDAKGGSVGVTTVPNFVYNPNPSSDFLAVSPGTGANAGVQGYQLFGTLGVYEVTTPNSMVYSRGHLIVSNDNFTTLQYIKLPGLGNQPLLPSQGRSSSGGTYTPPASQLQYTDVPESDPLKIYLGSTTTGVGDNLYVFSLDAYGEYDPVTPGNSVNRYKVRLYLFQPGPDLNDAETGSTWTLVWSSSEFLWVGTQTAYSVLSATRGFSIQTNQANNADWVNGSPPTEMVLEVRWVTSSGFPINNFINTYYLQFSNQSTATDIPAPSGLTWTPTGADPGVDALTFDVINSRWVGMADNSTGTWPTLPVQGPCFYALGTNESRFDTNATLTQITETELGNIWEP